jgi:D-alanyl-D-alanine carboxypeptidase
VLFGAGNVVTTLGDLEIWARALATGALLKPATQRARIGTMLPTGAAALPLPGALKSVLPLSYGLGIASIGNLLGHNGAIPPFGFTAETWYLPSVRGSVIVLLNSVTPCASGLLSDVIAGTIPQIAYGTVASGAASAPGLLGDGCPSLKG